jgi:hypothetical protein
MSTPVEVVIDPNKQVLRLYCGQCGDAKDIFIEVHRGRLNVTIMDAEDMSNEDHKEMLLSPVEIIV